jgi:hypothetical protein
MAAEITQIDTQDFTSQTYEGNDVSLLSSFDINTSLSSSSYIEFFTYDNNQNLLFSDFNFTQYTVQNDGQSAGNEGNISEIILDPEKSLVDNGFDQGEYITYFNFLNHQIGSNLELLYISEISSDRTEIRLDSTSLTNEDIVEKTTLFIQERENSPYFLDFYLNFGDNNLVLSNNIQLDNTDPNNPTILIKLYESLPEEFDLNSTLWVVTTVEEPRAYKVTFEDTPIIISDTISLKGPNFNLDLKDQVNNSTLSLSYTDLIYSPLTSSQNQINSLLEEKEIDVNIDYTNFSDFVHFSSAKTRIENFYYKVSLLEQYSSSIAILNNTTNNNPSDSIAIYEGKISDIITNFDGYDYYLYYSSGSWAYPKTTTEPPYQLDSTTNPTVLTWLGSDDPDNIYYGGIILSASIYDGSNKDNLYFVIPEYLREDPSNDPYVMFIDMVGQHYDNIWVYYKDVTQKYNADNRLESGISKDIVADAIRDFGVKLYQNNFSNEDLYTAFLGLTPEGALFPFPNITGSLPTPSGFEYIDTLISASNDYLPLDDVNKSLYKRIYHNLPYLLKSKGTIPGLRALITSYGIPDTILRINEYGGKDKVDSNDWDYWQNEFNYAFKTEGNNFITSSWDLNTDWDDSRPSTVLFRFKTNGLPESNIPYSQSLWNKGNRVHAVLTYTGSGYISGSYSGSIKDPYHQYATLTLYPAYNTNPTVSSSIYLPFFDGGWWSVMAKKSGSLYSIHSGNKMYEGGENGTSLGFYASSSVTVTSNDWRVTTGGSTFASSSIINGSTYNPFSGSLQEIRYYQYAFGNSLYEENEFKDYIMNPYSIEGNSLNSGPNELAFRASLGGELYTGSNSIHPKVTGSWIPTSSFTSGNSFYFNSTPTFTPNTEYFFYDQPIVGIKNTVSDKIRIEENTLPSGNTLSPFRRLEQVTEASSSYTPNINYLEVAFSPQNEINEDIMDQLGFFNIGDYIGDPSERFSGTSYPNLDNLRNAYFEKYTKNYNLVDFIRLIKFFDNSLFKMIKDFVPARTSLASGVVIKQHLLERNKYPQPQIGWEDITYSGSIKSTQVWDPISQSSYISHSLIENFSGGTAGSFEIFNGINTSPYGPNGTGPENIYGITQSWNETYQTSLGEVTVLHDSQEEFYDGEFDGSVILVTTQSLNQPYPLENASFEYTPILYRNGLYGVVQASTFTENQFLNSLTIPHPGEILIMAPRRGRVTLSNPSGGKGKSYVKIHKFDCNGNNNNIPLGQLSNILIKYTTLPYVEYNVINISEYPTYYLYEISNQNIDILGTGIDNEIKNYYTSASITTPYNLGTGQEKIIVNWNNELGDSLSYFNTSSGVLTFNNTSNIPIYITSSLTTSGSISSTGIFSLRQLRNGVESIIISQNHDVSTLTTSTISSSIFPLKGDQYYLVVTRGSFSTGFLQVSSSQLLITQSISPTASVCDPIILEPYITTPNFYNSDQNPTINNAFDDRLSTIYQDVDYSTGITIPTNFEVLINGNAQKAAVQDSNYTTQRHIIPRYEGSKSTSQFLNKWTSGDEGTYGKLPTIESLKTYVAYCDFIGGWPPERMNASGAHILYLIKEDGTVVIPNTSENSLSINKGTFESGERVSIESQTTSTSGDSNFRNIIRGGTRIEPILYTQIGHSSPSWSTGSNAISFSNIDPSAIGSYSNVAGKYSRSTTQTINFPASSEIVQFPNTTLGTPLSTYILPNTSYIVSQSVIDEALDLYIGVKINFKYIDTSSTDNIDYLGIFIRKVDSSGNNPVNLFTKNILTTLSNPSTYIYSNTDYTIFSPGLGEENNPNSYQYYIDSMSSQQGFFKIPSTLLSVGDKIFVEVITQFNDPSSQSYQIKAGSSFIVNQYPTPIPSIDIPPPYNPNTLWGYPNPTTYPNVITSSNPGLVEAYGNLLIKQTDIPNSGFNPISIPWSIKYGDEFRFEGMETYTFMVNKIFPPEELSPERISPTGSIEVHFDNNLPINSTPSIFNLDHFLIRRYINDASLILLEGFKPIGSQGPFILKPEYCSPELNKNIDQFILDLTQKGLL